MKYLLTGVAAIAMLTACGDKEKAQSASESTSDPVAAIKVLKGDPATAQQALDAFAFVSTDRLSFAGSELNGDTAVFTDVTFHAPESDDSDFDDTEFKAERVEIQGLAMVDDTPQFARLLLSNFTMVPDEVEETDGSISVSSMELINPSPETAAFVASLFTSDEEPEMPDPAVFAFDKWAINGVDFEIDDEDEQGSMTVDSFEINKLADKKMAQFAMTNFVFSMLDDETDLTANIDLIDLRGMDLEPLMEAASDTDEFANSLMTLASPSDPANPGYDKVEVKNLTVNVSGAAFAMPSMTSGVERDSDGRVVKVATDPFTMTLSGGEGELGEMLGAQLATLGYEQVELTLAGEQTYDPATDMMTMAKGKNYWELKDGFRMDFSGKYAGLSEMVAAQQDIDPAELEDPTELIDMYSNVAFHNLEIAFDDNGFVDRAFNAYAAQTGEDPQQVRNQLAGLLAMAPMMAGGSGVDMDLITEASAAMSSFVSDPKTLTIALQPVEPLKLASLIEMEDPSQITKSSLGFSAKNE